LIWVAQRFTAAISGLSSVLALAAEVSATQRHEFFSNLVQPAKNLVLTRVENLDTLTTRIVRATRIIRDQMNMSKQNVTISLTRQTLQKVRVLAARRSTSISGLLAEQVDILVGEEEAYERAQRQAMTLLDQGFHMGGVIRASRDELHER
jgi:hypothetical protein